MPVEIIRPNGKPYRPRAIRCVPLCQDEDSPVDTILVLGTHDLADARARAEVAVRDEAAKIYTDTCGYTMRLKDEPGERGWWARRFWGFYEDWPMYTYPTDEERGAAGVSFAVEEVEVEVGRDPR